MIMDLLSLAFAGGVEAIKIVAPQLGVPIEVAKRLYEIYDRNCYSSVVKLKFTLKRSLHLIAPSQELRHYSSETVELGNVEATER